MTRIRLLAAFIISLTIAGCGLKGDLYLEEDAPAPQEVAGSDNEAEQIDDKDDDENADPAAP